MGGGGGGGGRVPQWGQQETRELIAIRGDMERGKRSAGAAASSNKTLWEEVAARMRQRGYTRTPDQCKCKWKNLVNRYKVSASLGLCPLCTRVWFSAWYVHVMCFSFLRQKALQSVLSSVFVEQTWLCSEA